MNHFIRSTSPLMKTFGIPGIALIGVIAWSFLFSAVSVQAETAGNLEMEQVARNWLTYIVSESGSWAGSLGPKIVGSEDIVENDTLLGRYYAVSPKGYIVVPVLKDLAPVKAYSDECPLDLSAPDGFALMLRQVLQGRIRLFVEVYGSLEAVQPRDQQPLFGSVNREQWNRLTASPEEFAAGLIKAQMESMDGVEPLLTSAWHQGAPYNNLCPWGDGGRCVVGCVATAAAQIMNYHKWPPAGEGSNSYYWPGDNSCGGSSSGQTLSADFTDPYSYDGSAASVAEISYEMGIAFNMDYGACGSGAYTLDGSYVFPTYFRYSDLARTAQRAQHTAETWFDLIKSDLNKGRPILYRIYSHAIVCDGWRSASGLNQYHFNYGWADGHTAWYTVDNLHCPWVGCDTEVEGMVYNIIPENGSPWLSSNRLSDAVSGDGDSIPEGGETIELTLTLANYGGAPITDVTVSLSIDDASLTILDGSSALGDINAFDSVTATDLMVFAIPAGYLPRTDSLFYEVSWNGGTMLDTIITEVRIGGTTVLLVDDDETDDVDTYIRATFDNFRIPYDVWIHSAYASPDSAYLSRYDFVCWFTGDYRTNPLNTNEVTALKGYLNAGGNLFLTGQRIAAQLNTTDLNFLNNYLKSSYSSSNLVPVLKGEPGGQVFDTSATVAIAGAGGASNQQYPDYIDPVNGGVAELRYLGQSHFGAVSYAGSYKLVFFAFGFEAVVSGDSRWAGRDSVLAEIMRFVNYQPPNGYPSATNLTVTPGDRMHLLDHTPDFAWTYHDGESSQTMYQFQVGSNSDWTQAEMWDTGPVSGAETAIGYTGLDLLDGQRYYARVRVFDGALWSDWLLQDMRLNSAPPVPGGLTPANMVGTGSATPNLIHNNTTDAEADVIKYSYEVYDDAALTVLVASAYGQSKDAGATSSWTVSTPLADDEDYYWRVRSEDPYENGLWSDPASFWVNSVNLPPGAFDLLTPTNASSLTELLPTFSWEASTDPDLLDRVRYTLSYATDSNFTSAHVISSLDTTAYALTDSLLYGTTYYWKVKAYDLFGGQAYSLHIYTVSTLKIGDANCDGQINVGDAVFLINHVFRGGPAPDPFMAGDANCDGSVNVGDAVFLINHVFKQGPPPGC